MNYQILALDLDGTLINSKKEISQPTLKALINIQEQGKKVVLASGRPAKGVLPLAEQLHLQDYGSYILSFNGGRITDCRSKEVIYNKTLPEDVAAPLFHSIGLTAEQMICCGDGYNDLTMIETAGLGVAMANAQPLVREKADYITKSNDEDGVLHVIHEFMIG